VSTLTLGLFVVLPFISNIAFAILAPRWSKRYWNSRRPALWAAAGGSGVALIAYWFCYFHSRTNPADRWGVWFSVRQCSQHSACNADPLQISSQLQQTADERSCADRFQHDSVVYALLLDTGVAHAPNAILFETPDIGVHHAAFASADEAQAEYEGIRSSLLQTAPA